MTTYVITVPDDDAVAATSMLIAVADVVAHEDVTTHCIYWHLNPFTGDEISSHTRLGITVRKVS